MLCAERIQRIIQAIILGLIMGLAGSKMFAAAFVVTLAMMIMLLIAGFTGFCPGLMALEKIFPSCRDSRESKDK